MSTAGTDRVIHKLLVANRGEIARRVMRTCREMGVATVAVYSEADTDALFVREADQAVLLGGPAPADSYLRGDAVIAAAKETGADAIHPGYGFLAENADFARAVVDAGLIWVGPTPEAIVAMGSKVEARERMEKAGVPVLPGVTLGSPDANGELKDAAATIGFPLLAKASAGGGGKGMRLVTDPADLEESVAAAAREAESAFGDGTIFLERYVEAPRHVEIQIFGDEHGTVVSLFERECSIQRRHQKVIEESPSPAVDPELRAKMGAAAVAAGESIGYVGAGTVEFLLAPEGEFFFLEVNTRLQVEHPVTEFVTGLDLVRLQLEVACGAALPAEVREPVMNGHAIEARLCAEDPRNEFLPVSGHLERFELPDDVRLDTGVESGSEIPVHYDSMIAKVIVHAPTREQAALKLADALARAQVHGLTTNRELLVRTLRHDEFLAGQTDTHFLERHDPVQLGAPLIDAAQAPAYAVVAAIAIQAVNRAEATALATMPSGWRNNPSQGQTIAFESEHGELDVSYTFDRHGGVSSVSVAGEEIDFLLHDAAPGLVDATIGGVRRRCTVDLAGQNVWVNASEGQLNLTVRPRFPDAGAQHAAGSLTSPMPGAVIRVGAAIGDKVAAGDVIVVIEAMKMEHGIAAPGDGVLAELLVAQGDQVDTGALLAVIEESD
jgi:acetyl/propionyl-CoA carboxylase alpha subunit